VDNLNSILSKLISEELYYPAISDLYINSFNPGYEYGQHKHADIEVLTVLNGICCMTINNRNIHLKKNECLIVFPDTLHSFSVSGGEKCKLLNLLFRPGHIMDLLEIPGLEKNLGFFYELKTNRRSYLRLADSRLIRNITERIYGEAENDGILSEALLRNYFSELYLQLSRILDNTYNMFNRSFNHHVSDALTFIHDFYNDNISVENVAANTGISARQLSRLFMMTMDMTVTDCINFLRIKKAKELLEETDMSLTQIALLTGFSTSQYFSTCFKKHEGKSPNAYRKLYNDLNLNNNQH